MSSIFGVPQASDHTTGVPALKPRWAPNTYGLGGIGMLIGGAVLVGLVVAVAEVRQEAGWLALMGGGFVVGGGVWAWLVGRWGRLDNSSRAARDGVAGQAVIIAVQQTTARRKTTRWGGTTHRVVGLDLDVEAVGVARYRLRVYRNLPVRLLTMATVGQRLGVRVLPDRPRRIDLEWPEPDPAPATTLTITRQGAGITVSGAGPMFVAGRDASAWATTGEPRTASARVGGVRDIPSQRSPWPMAEYDLTVSMPGQAPYSVRIIDRGPASDGLVGTDVPVTVGADPRHVAIVWGPAA